MIDVVGASVLVERVTHSDRTSRKHSVGHDELQMASADILQTTTTA